MEEPESSQKKSHQVPADPIEKLAALLLDLQPGQELVAAESEAEALDELQQLLTEIGAPNPLESSQTPISSAPQAPHQTAPPFSTPPRTRTSERVTDLETKLAKLEKQIYQPTELLDPLIPLVVELLQDKETRTQHEILRAIVPQIDEVIRQRYQEAPQKISAAIAAILPQAIAHQIEQRPEEIARAIAPEIALSIQEQIRLDRDALSQTLGPEMGQAIKVQIEQERDAMVDALYPVIGSTISKYMAEVVQSINQQVESALSVEGIKRKIRAKVQGVSEAELILQESIQPEVKAAFLIHKASGFVISTAQPPSNPQLPADLVAGMLTAVRNFVNDCMVRSGEIAELSEIEYGDSKIVLEVAGYCYLAVSIRGNPTQQLLGKLRETVSTIVLECDRAIQNYDGNPDTAPELAHSLVQQLVEPEEEKPKSPVALIILLLAAFSVVFIPVGFVQYRSRAANRLERQVAAALGAAPELSVYRLVPEVSRGKLMLSGRVPSQALQLQAIQIAQATAQDWELDNRIVAVDVPRDPAAVAEEVERTTQLLNQREGTAIVSRYQEGSVAVEGTVSDAAEATAVTQAFKKIPGVRSVIITARTDLPDIQTRIYFDSNSAQIERSAADNLASVQQFLAQYPNVHLRVIGHADAQGQAASNQGIARDRTRAVQQALAARGVDPARLQLSVSTALPPGVTSGQPLWMSRCVRFEAFLPEQ